jgi:hypothetical protein
MRCNCGRNACGGSLLLQLLLVQHELNKKIGDWDIYCCHIGVETDLSQTKSWGRSRASHWFVKSEMTLLATVNTKSIGGWFECMAD